MDLYFLQLQRSTVLSIACELNPLAHYCAPLLRKAIKHALSCIIMRILTMAKIDDAVVDTSWLLIEGFFNDERKKFPA